MDKNPRDREVSQRLRELVDKRYPARGRFGALEEVSGISENKWKNFYYKKQEATQELVYFWCKKYPEESDWLKTGIESPDQKGYPFGTRVAKKFEGQTIGDRLNWVIAEWAAPSGEQLFKYLAEKNESITASDWAQVVLRTSQPTIEMIAVVAEFRPHFLEWIIRGKVTTAMQVDPTDQSSVSEWTKNERKRWDSARKVLQKIHDNQTE